MACDPQTLINNSSCIACNIPTGMQVPVLIYLLCQIQSGGGVGGGVQVFAASGAPTTQVPANNAGVYYDYTNKITYYWNPTLPGSNKWE